MLGRASRSFRSEHVSVGPSLYTCAYPWRRVDALAIKFYGPCADARTRRRDALIQRPAAAWSSAVMSAPRS